MDYTKLVDFQAWFEPRFATLLHTKIAAFSAHSNNTTVAGFASYIETLAHGGKRFRPYLVALASRGTEADYEALFPLLAAVELVHIFALIHDDIMDDATTRHGVDCAHTVFEKSYGKKTGESIAILIGDLVFAWSYECLASYGAQHPQTRVAVEQEFATLISEVTHGQILDVLSPLDTLWSLEQIVEKMTLKTARYSFVQPLRIGCAASGSADTTFPESFGIPLGIAFQIQDDLLDAQPATDTGKSSFTDIQTRQQTVLSWYMQTRATTVQKEQFLTYYGKAHLTNTETQALAELLENSGAHAYTTTLSHEYFAKARTVATSENALWNTVVDMVEKRKK